MGKTPPVTRTRGAWVPLLAAVIVIVIAGLRVLVSFSPQLWWATDPRLDDTPVLGFGPLGAAVTDWLSIVALALAVLHGLKARWRIHVVLIALWLFGVVFAMGHGAADPESQRIGGSWLGALALGLAAMHLAGEPTIRRWMIAAVIALLVPLSGQAILQVTVEHAQTVENYNENPEKFLRARGWEPGSIEAVQYEVRLYQREATGRIGLSNVFGSVAMTLTVLAAGIALGVWRGRRDRGKPGGASTGLLPQHDPLEWPAFSVAHLRLALTVLVSLLGLVTLFLTFSKGAVLAMLAAVAAVGVAWTLPTFRWKWPLVGALIVAAGIGGVAVRGAIGAPETPEGERSLLFRWYYWQAAASMVREEPITGVGPGRFQEEYLAHKNPLNPEEVTDPHNVFIAFIATLGLGGWAWAAVLVGLLGYSGLRVTDHGSAGAEKNDSRFGISERPRLALYLTLVAALLIFLTEYATTLYMIGFMGLLLPVLALVLCAIGVAAWRGKVKGSDGKPLPQGREIGLSIIIITLAALTVFFPTLGAWLIGAAGFVLVATMLGTLPELDGPTARLGLFTAACAMLLHAQIEMSLTNTMSAPLLCVVLGLVAGSPDPAGRRWVAWIMFGVLILVIPSLFLTHVLRTAGDQIHLSSAADAVRRAGVDMESVVMKDLGKLRDMPHIARYEAQLWVELGEFDAAFQALETAREAGPRRAQLWHAESAMAREAYRVTKDRQHLKRAATAAAAALKLDPYNTLAYIDAADLAWELGRYDRSRELYRRALELNQLAYLIPHKQLRNEQLVHVRQRLDTAAR